MTTFEQRKAQLADTINKARRSKIVRGGFVLLAIGVGAYYGTKQPFNEIVGDVREMRQDMDDIRVNTYQTEIEVGNLALLMMEQAEEKRDEVNKTRDIITDLVREGKEFTFYPGVGALDHEVARRSSKKK